MLRLAGTALKNTGKFLINNMGQGPGEIALRIVPDVGFGVLAATQTPGDLGDKLIAGGSQAAGGILGGVGTVGLLRKVRGLENQQGLLNLADMAGSVAGDFAGMAVGDLNVIQRDLHVVRQVGPDRDALPVRVVHDRNRAANRCFAAADCHPGHLERVTPS